MHIPRMSANRSAFTLIEVLVILVIVTLLAIVILPQQARKKAKSQRIKGVSNLKQVGLAFRLFSTDHGDRMPMEVPKEEGGVKEIFDKRQVKRS